MQFPLALVLIKEETKGGLVQVTLPVRSEVRIKSYPPDPSIYFQRAVCREQQGKKLGRARVGEGTLNSFLVPLFLFINILKNTLLGEVGGKMAA